MELDTFSSTSTTRLQALYSDFSRQKTSNPASYQANVEWWRKALETIVSSGFQDEHGSVYGKKQGSGKSRLVLHANATLLDQVKIPRVGKPLALGAVLSELHASHSFYPLAEFTSLKSSIYSTHSLPIRIASYVVGKPLWWALEQMGIVGEEGILGSSTRDHKGTAWHGDYVIIALAAKAAETIQEMQRDIVAGPADSLYSFESFRKTFGVSLDTSGAPLSELDAKVLLKFMERDRGVLVYDNDVIKFVDEDAPAEDRIVTPVDRGILELKSAVQNMHTQVNSLQEKIDQCTRQASEALQKERKPLALSYIRSRKTLQEVLSKRLGSLATLESTLVTVETAAGDVEIMKSYESSTATLKSILSHPSLQRENVDKTMEALAEANADAREIDDAVRVGADVALGVENNVDESELEAEWAEMVKQLGKEKEEEESQAERKKLGAAELRTPQELPQDGRKTPEKVSALST
ncbi:hypothetical protein DFP72DRAFT_956150 [Ephemerocybe angulata]|uniref:Uncharacterized protein n=1 Tax=Ephemerocybe angulata TaxID=980116 RepID=A0A8H6IED2_9AGAR|nr:hypothetical protein DFP72DRAFT_956150 [Tulosesus angulatus]